MPWPSQIYLAKEGWPRLLGGGRGISWIISGDKRTQTAEEGVANSWDKGSQEARKSPQTPSPPPAAPGKNAEHSGGGARGGRAPSNVMPAPVPSFQRWAGSSGLPKWQALSSTSLGSLHGRSHFASSLSFHLGAREQVTTEQSIEKRQAPHSVMRSKMHLGLRHRDATLSI